MPKSGFVGPSVLGSAFGFGWAGMGLGALAWMSVAPSYTGAGDDLPAKLTYARIFYGGCFLGLLIGTAAGACAGAAYALWRRKVVEGGP